MKFCRINRFLAVSVALFSMLFMQFASASYVCPGIDRHAGYQKSSRQMEAAIDRFVMTNCDAMDANQPALCHLQSKGDIAKQLNSKMQLADIQPFLPLRLTTVLPSTNVDRPCHHQIAPTDFLSSASAPPLSILNCCFRI
jgi:hypothetical protein